MQRGYSVLEVTLAAAIAAIALSAALALSRRTAPFAAAGAAMQFDAAVTAARALATSSGNGATLTVRKSGAQTTLQVYAGRPDGETFSAVGPPETLHAAVMEATLGPAPFSVFWDSAVRITGSAGGRWPRSEPGCPSGGFVLTFGGGGASRTLACSGPEPAASP